MTLVAEGPEFVATSDDLDWTNEDLHLLDPNDPLVLDQGVYIDGYDLDGSDPDLGAYGGPLGDWVP